MRVAKSFLDENFGEAKLQQRFFRRAGGESSRNVAALGESAKIVTGEGALCRCAGELSSGE
jgi:hypothetical protein